MAGKPWEKYGTVSPQSPNAAASPSSVTGSPWTKYAQPGAASTPAAPAQAKPSLGRRILDWAPPVATAEAAASIGSGMLVTPVAGVAGLAQGAANLVGLGTTPAADRIRSIQEGGTYQPRTKLGQITTNAIAYPFEKLAQGADIAGSKTAEVTGSPALGAGVNTLIQSAPAILARGARGVRAAPRAGLPPEAEAAPKTPTPATPEAAAKDYVARNTALDWNRLSDEVKTRLTDIAKDSKDLSKLDPAALEREARLGSLRVKVPATRGQILRDDPTLRREQVASATESGRPIYDVYERQNQALLDNLEVLKGRKGGKAASQEQLGEQVQDKALRAKLDAKKKEVSDLYKQAQEKGELQGKVSPRPLVNVLKGSPDLTHLGWVESWMNKMGVVGKGPKGETYIKKMPLKDLEDLRQAAVARAMNGGTEGYYAGKVIRALDEATEGGGGEAYKAARAARKQMGLEFEDQASVARLVENKTRTDRTTALEDTWRKTVLGGSIEDLRNVKRSLMTGGTQKTRVAGRQAWRDIRAQTIQHIIDESTKSVAPRASGAPNITPAAMQKTLRSIGDAKLNEIFGERTTAELNEILKATRDVKTSPPPGHPGSSSVANALNFLEGKLSKVPGIGGTAAGLVNLASKATKLGETGRIAREAIESPLTQSQKAAAQSRSMASMRKRYGSSAPIAGQAREDSP